MNLFGAMGVLHMRVKTMVILEAHFGACEISPSPAHTFDQPTLLSVHRSLITHLKCPQTSLNYVSSTS